MNVNRIVFFNQWRNGDCFIGKEYVRDIVSLLPKGLDITYAHGNYPDIVCDLNLPYVPIKNIPQFNIFQQFAADGDTLYINTWPGCLIPKYMGEKEHANFKRLKNMWNDIYATLGLNIGHNFEDYLPTIDWKHHELDECDEYLKKIEGKRLILICNGVQQSEQSSMGNMRNVVHTLATEYPNCEFLVTDELDFDLPNVTYTGTTTRDMNSDNVLFGPMVVGSLNKIAYLSQFAELIVGKNSGAFTYAHLKSSIDSPNKTYMCFSHKLEDCLLGDGTYTCNSYWSGVTDDENATRILKMLIDEPTYTNAKKPTLEIL